MSLNEALRRIKKSRGLLVTPLVERWLVQHPEGVVMGSDTPQWVKDTALRLLTDTSNHQRESRFGASSRGHCLRFQLFRYLGMPGRFIYDPRQQNLMNDGTWGHIRWQLMGLLSGALDGVEVAFKSKKHRVKVSADGVDSKRGFFFELKRMMRYNQVVIDGPPHPHLLQMYTVKLASGLDIVSYVIEDKMTLQWHEMVIELNDKKIEVEVRKELDVLNQSVEDEKLPPVLPGCYRRKGEVWQGCPYRETCPHQEDWPEGRVWYSEMEVRGRRRRRRGTRPRPDERTVSRARSTSVQVGNRRRKAGRPKGRT